MPLGTSSSPTFWITGPYSAGKNESSPSGSLAMLAQRCPSSGIASAGEGRAAMETVVTIGRQLGFGFVEDRFARGAGAFPIHHVAGMPEHGARGVEIQQLLLEQGLLAVLLLDDARPASAPLSPWLHPTAARRPPASIWT